MTVPAHPRDDAGPLEDGSPGDGRGAGGTWAVIAGGGTAGHALPAVAIGRALVGRGHAPSSIHFVGARRGMEARLVPEAGFSITLLPGRGIERRLTAGNVAALAGLLAACGRALLLLARRRPAVVVSVGGYASVPCSLAAVLLRVPLVVAESNAVAGLANRLAGRFARAAAVAFPGTGLPREEVTGNPVRPEILAVDRTPAGRSAARRALGLPDRRRVLAVTGGSLGARRINEATLGLAGSWADRTDVSVRHAVGSRDWASVSQRLPAVPDTGLVYQPVEYESRMDLVLAAADLLVARAGGTTLAEVTTAGVPAILVPLPIAPNDHQAAGARVLEEAGAAVMVRDERLTAEWLAETAGALLADEDRLAAMAAAARRLGRPDAAERVAELVDRHARL